MNAKDDHKGRVDYWEPFISERTTGHSRPQAGEKRTPF